MIGFNRIIVLGVVWKIKPVVSRDWGQLADFVVLCQTFSPKGGFVIDDYFDITTYGELARTVFPKLTLGDIVFVNGVLRKRRIQQRTFINIQAQSIDVVAKGTIMDSEKIRQQIQDDRLAEMALDDEAMRTAEHVEANFSTPSDPDLKD